MREKQHDVSLPMRVAYGGFGFGSNLVGGILGAFLTLYLTDNLLLSGGFIAGMMFACRITNGVGELLVGLLIDKTKSKLGKARPWILVGSFTCALPVWLLFSTPQSFSMFGKQVWVAVMYLLHTSVFGAMISVAAQTLVIKMSRKPHTRTSMLVINTLLGQIAVLITGSWGIPMLMYFGGYQTGYKWMSLVFCGVGFLAMLATGVFCKELTDEEAEEIKQLRGAEENKQKENLLYQYKCIFTNKYMIFALLIYIVFFFTTMISSSGAVYFARDILNNAQFMAQISMATTIPAIILMLIGVVPLVVSKLGTRRALVSTMIVNAVGAAIMAVNPGSVIFVTVGKVVCSIAGALYGPIIGTAVANIADYVHMKDHFDAAGKVTSVCSAGMKIGMGLGSVGLVIALEIGKYSAKAANDGLQQSASALLAEKACFIYIPLICYIIIAILSSTLDVEKKIEHLKVEKNAK